MRAVAGDSDPASRTRLIAGAEDPWQSPGRPGLPRPALPPDLGRRARGLTWLAVQSVVGLVVVVGLLILFGFLLAMGWDPAGWLIGLTLLLAFLGLARTAVRGSRLLSSAPVAPEAVAAAPGSSLAGDEAQLLALLRAGERALPAPTRSALHATVIATRDALRVTADDPAFGRDTHDARQAAREDLPELLRTYQTAHPTPETDRLFLEQLDLIGRRMQEVVHERQAQHVRTLTAQRRYLETKYSGEED